MFSLVLSPHISEGKKMTIKDFKNITEDFLKDLGFDLKEDQFIAFCHLEKKYKHIHILMNRVDKNGKLKKDHFIGKRAQWSAHRIAERNSLISAKMIRVEKMRAAEKKPEKGIKKEIYKKHIEVMESLPLTLQQYIERMRERGLNLMPSINKQNQLQGFRVSNSENEFDFKCSDIHKSMSLRNLLEVGLALDEETAIHPNLEQARKISLVKSRELQEMIKLENEKINIETYFTR